MLSLSAVFHDLEPDAILDVGGNVGEFATRVRNIYPDALLTSFEPVPQLARANRERARGRWLVEEVALGAKRGTFPLHICTNQHSASTMRPPGPGRRTHFGISDHWQDVMVPTRQLDEYADRCRGCTVLKVDVEGFEGEVLLGARDVLLACTVVVVEVQQDPTLFLGSWRPVAIGALLAGYGFEFDGVADALPAPGGQVVQFDGVWRRP
jgi:FkbM family methyltransferase